MYSKKTDSSAVHAAAAPAPATQFSSGLWFLTGGQIIHLLGDHALTVAVSAFTYGMTGSAWAFALQQFIMYLPWLVFSPLAGPLVDRLDRRKVMAFAEIARGICCLGYGFCATLEPILLLTFLTSTCRVFSFTARTALIPRLCEKDAILKANGLRAAILGVIDLTVPALAGAVIAKTGAVAAFPFTTVASFLGASLFVMIPTRLGCAPAITTTSEKQPEGERARSTSVREAWAFLRSDTALLGFVALYCVYAAGQHGTNALFYPFVDSVLKGGPAVFGLAVSMYFGAGIVAGILLARFGKVVNRIPATAMIVLPMLVWVSYSVVRRIPIILAIGVCEGLTISVLTNLLMTKVQSRAPAEMTGRVWGLVQTLSSASEVSGILFAGAIAERFGTPTAYKYLGLIGLTVVSISVAAQKAGRGFLKPDSRSRKG